MDRIYSLLGLATRAGKTKSGGFLVEEAIRSGKARLVIVAEDAGKNTLKTIGDKCNSYEVPIRYYGTKDELGHAIGQESRSCVCVTDEGFKGSLEQLLEGRERGNDGEY